MDLNNLNIVPDSLMRTVSAINSEIDSSLAAVEETAQRKAASERATIATAKNVSEISGKVQAIEGWLSGEREERKAADEENKKYTRSQTRWANIRSWISIIIAILAFALSVMVNWSEILLFFCVS